MVGAGVLAPELIRAHTTVRPIKRMSLWNRTRGRAVQAAFALTVGGLEVEVDRRSRGGGARRPTSCLARRSRRRRWCAANG
jgi:ornithine cyclodeaminase